jgi:CubicO group peptidase (beta-lactamase class C family)
MKNIILLFGLLLASQFCLSQGNPNPSSSLDAAIQSEMTNENLPGVSTVIVKDGKIVWVESYGFADVENSVMVEDSTIFLLASMSKLFTGTASMQLLESGQVDLDTDISTYLTWPLDVPGFETDSITIRQLMTHTSSIEDAASMDNFYDYPDPSIALGDCIQAYFSMSGTYYDPADNFFNNAPGTAYNYSNMGTALNGFITETVSGVGFDDFCDDNIFEPLCMNNTAWHFSDFDSADVARPHQYVAGNYVPYNHYGFADYPDGQLRSNVFDLANFMIAYMDDGDFGSNNILSAASINEMWTPQVPGLDPTQGLNWYQEEIYFDGGGNSNMLWGHNGGENGVSTDIYVDPVNNIGICVLTNGEGDGLYICDELYDYAMSLVPVSSMTPACLMASIDTDEIGEISVYPNPVKDIINLSSDNFFSKAMATLTDAQGRVIYQNIYSGNSLSIDVSECQAGVYFLNVKSDHQILDVKVVVQ